MQEAIFKLWNRGKNNNCYKVAGCSIRFAVNQKTQQTTEEFNNKKHQRTITETLVLKYHKNTPPAPQNNKTEVKNSHGPVVLYQPKLKPRTSPAPKTASNRRYKACLDKKNSQQ
jgi:hypothetical protein